MTSGEILALFLEKIPADYPSHMLCYFCSNASCGIFFPFTSSLLYRIGLIEAACPGYASEMFDRIGKIEGTGEDQYEAIIQILAEIYVTAGLVERADQEDGKVLFAHEPGPRGEKNPEFEVRIKGQWCAIEVKTPRLIQHGRNREANPWQVGVRLPKEMTDSLQATLPRDNPVKDFLVSAESKFAVYEGHRPGALRILIIVWDDFCYEPISALVSPIAGLLTPQSFHRKNEAPVTFSHIDGVIVLRHQHQIIRSTRCEPLIDGLDEPFRYHFDGFPPKTFIEVPGGREVPAEILSAFSAVPLAECIGAEYHPAELIMWIGKADRKNS